MSNPVDRPRTTCVYCGRRITPPNHGGRCDPLRRFVRGLACAKHAALVLLDHYAYGRPQPW